MNNTLTKSSTCIALVANVMFLIGSGANAQTVDLSSGLTPGDPFVVYVADDPDIPIQVLTVGYVPDAGRRILDASQVGRLAARGLSTFVRTPTIVILIEPVGGGGGNGGGKLTPKAISSAQSGADMTADMGGNFQRVHTGRGKLSSKPSDPVIIFCPKAPSDSSPLMVDVKTVSLESAQKAGSLQAGMGSNFQRVHTSRSKLATK
jgi:hypothetical protein